MAVKTYVCIDCGKEFAWDGYKAPGRRRCQDCAMKRMTDTITQLQEKSGPEYEKWKHAIKEAARRL